MSKNLKIKKIRNKYKSQTRKKKTDKIQDKLVNDITDLIINTFDKTKELKAIATHLNSAIEIINRELDKNEFAKKHFKRCDNMDIG